MTLEQWLTIATRNLAQSSVERVRSEIQQHVEEAQANGDDPIRALGDPRAANREYRKVLLTTTEAAIAPNLTRRQSPAQILGQVALMGLLAWLIAGKRGGSWPVLAAIWSTAPLIWILPPTTRERNRIHVYAHIARDILAAGVSWWLRDWGAAATLAVMLAGADFFILRGRTNLFRKLDAGQAVLPFPGEPELTHTEAVLLNTFRNGEPYRAISIPILFVMLAAMAWWLPLTFAPLRVTMVIIFAARWLPITTPVRAQVYRIAKWSLEIAASLLPVYLGAPAPWTGAAFYAFIFLMFDYKRIMLRRKLPVEEWPRDLYY